MDEVSGIVVTGNGGEPAVLGRFGAALGHGVSWLNSTMVLTLPCSTFFITVLKTSKVRAVAPVEFRPELCFN